MNLEVIIIDDDAIVILIQKKMIVKSLFHDHPLSFLNGQLGFEYLLNNSGSDKMYFILLDINMPVMNGWEFLDAINQSPIADDILIAVVTSSTNESDKKRAFEYKQVIRYIEKPVNIQKLCELKQDKALKLFFTSEKR